MRIEMCPTVSFEDIEAEFGFTMRDVTFTDEVENGTYAFFALDEDAIAEHQEEIDEIEAFGDEDDAYTVRRHNQLVHELQLIKYFNSLGYDDAILICIIW